MSHSNPLPRRAASAILCVLGGLLGSTPALSGMMWNPEPMTVHEWGVHTFDWDAGERLAQELPGFLYTDRKSGQLIPKPDPRVRDLPADSGVRTKPILYFYPEGRRDAEVGVEMRFGEGYANAWWPQVQHYRTEAVSNAAGPPDWDSWRGSALERYEKFVTGNNEDGKAGERWTAEQAQYNRLDAPAQIAWLSNRLRWQGRPDYPEDERMQLVWEKLSLHQSIPEGMSLPGEALPDDHWLKIAREVDASYVNNGKEVERYVFYEGKTRELPAIAILPEFSQPRWFSRRALGGDDLALVNVSKHPIYDVVAVYRDSEKGILWTSRIPMLPALPSDQPQVDQVMALRIPHFDKPKEGDEIKRDPAEFGQRAREHLIENLTAGHHYDPGGVSMRDPADPQPPTRMHQLYKKEAVALERIWHDDFFQSEGLTVIYRESPAALDEAMPLNIFTSMMWYVKLSRCGLVLNRNIPIDEVGAIDEALEQFHMAQYNKTSEEELARIMKVLKINRFLTLGIAQYRFGRERSTGWEGSYTRIMSQVRGLFDRGEDAVEKSPRNKP